MSANSRAVGAIFLFLAIVAAVHASSVLAEGGEPEDDPQPSQLAVPGTVGTITATVAATSADLNRLGDCSLRDVPQAARNDSSVDPCPAGFGDDARLTAISDIAPGPGEDVSLPYSDGRGEGVSESFTAPDGNLSKTLEGPSRSEASLRVIGQSVAEGQIVVDGDPSDWATAGVQELIIDPVGDVATPTPDMLTLRVTDDGVNVYFLYEFAESPADYSYLHLDVDTDAATGCFGDEYGITFDPFDIESSYIGDSRDCSWGPSDFAGALTAAIDQNFIEASVAIETLMVLNPDLSQFHVTCSNDGCDTGVFELGPDNLSIVKSGSPDSVTPGGGLTYTLTISGGVSTSTGVSVTDTLPVGVTLVSATSTQGGCSGAVTVTCSIGTLSVYASAAVTIEVAVSTSTTSTITNTATVTANEADPNLANNTDTVVTTVGQLVPMAYSTDTQAFNMSWVAIDGVPLTTTKPAGVAAEPVYTTTEPFYAVLSFGDNGELGTFFAVVEVLPDDSILLYFDANDNGDLSDDPSYAANNGNVVNPIPEALLDYPSGLLPYALGFYHWDFVDELLYTGASLTHGVVELDGKARRIALLDTNMDGLYTPTANLSLGATDYGLSVIIDLDGDGTADGTITGDERLSVTVPIYLESGNAYKVADFSPDGRSLRVVAAAQGTVAGTITDSTGGLPIRGASVQLKPGSLVATSTANGSYTLPAAEGSYTRLLVKTTGYVPHLQFYGVGIAQGQTTSMNVALKPVGAMSGAVTLGEGDSYHFLANEFGARYTGGDFYLGFSNGTPRFWANNLGQRGVVDQGDLGTTTLDQVDPPQTGYTRYGVDPVAGRTYASLAREGEEGHFVVFNVVTSTTSTVDIEWLYTPSAAASYDLAVTKSGSPGAVVPGGNLTYVVTVTNNGGSTSTSVVLTDTLPTGVAYLSATSTQGTCNGIITVTCSIGALAGYASTTVMIQVAVSTSTTSTITNTVTVTANEFDPVAVNNTSIAITAVSTDADLSIAKSDTPDPVLPGDNLTYAVTVTNYGPNTSTGITVTDPLSSRVTFVSSTAVRGDCTESGGTVTCALDDLGGGASTTVTILVQVNATTTGVVYNTASVTGNEGDPNTGNNTATAVTRTGPSGGAEKVLRMRYKQSISHLNPFRATSRPHGWAFNLMGSRLIYPNDKTRTWEPDLAESWEVSTDALSYTFHLRQGARFHDGVEVTADDVVWSYNTYLNPAINPRPQALSIIKGGQDVIDGNATEAVGIVKVDDYTVRFDQEFANALFLDKCCAGNFVIMPKHILGNVPVAEFEAHPFHTSEFVGSGPFMMDTPFVADVGWTLRSNPDYFLGAPLIDKITFEFIESRDATVAAMQAGEIDMSTYPTLTTEYYQTMIDDPRFNVVGIQGSIMRSFMFHNEFVPAQDFRVRHAFLHALDRRALIDDFWQGNGDPINTPFQNPDWCDCAEWDSRYEYDPEKARQLLADAGWDENEVITNKTYYVDREDFFEAIQQMLADVGIQMETVMQQGPAWVEDYYNKSDFEIVFAGFGAPMDPSGWLDSQMSTAGQNGGRYGNPELEALIQAGKTGTTTAERALAYRAIAEDFIERMPFLPVFRQNEWWYKSNRFYHPLLDELDTATNFATIDIMPIYVNSGQWLKYHAELWDIKRPVASASLTASIGEGVAGATTADLIVVLSESSTWPTTIGYDTTDGTAVASGGDYTGVNGGTLVIPAGNVSGTIQIAVNGDDIYETDETFTVTLTTSTNAILSGGATTTVVTILNDDPMPALSVAIASAPEGASTSTAQVVVTLVGKTEIASGVSFTTADTSTAPAAVAGMDYQSTTAAIAFGANTSTDTTSTVVLVTVLEDNMDELDERFLVRLFGSTDATVAVGEATVTILDDDPAPTLSVLDLTVNETDGTASITVTLSGASDVEVSVDASTQDVAAVAGVDYVSTSVTLTWAPTESGDRTFLVPLINDGIVEGPRLVTIVLSNARTSPARPGGAIIADQFGGLKIIDDEAPHITEIPALTWVGMMAMVLALSTLLHLRFRAARRERV